MQESSFSFVDHDGHHIHGYRWMPEEHDPVALIQIVHGMGDHSARYRAFADVLCHHGYAVYAIDQRGHGRTAEAAGLYGYLGPDGFTAMVDNTRHVFELAARDFPHRPWLLLGHSMGSYVVQRFIQRHGHQLAGAVLVGTSGNLGLTVHAGVYLAGRFARRRGDRAHFPLAERLTFTSYNNRFRPVRTPFDWLSRDAAAVDDYISDPMSGRVLTAGSFRDLLIGLRQLFTARNMRLVPKQLPILMISGDQDPLGKNGKSVLALARSMRSCGLTNVQVILYPGSRHDILHDTAKDHVIADVLSWWRGRIERTT